ncbi:MAG: hypothetical protein A3J28_05510 [Acidobacteria bacterium RIFCSPLOWO2_12_FULL_60_22]|nr:MAG: hypothetical protein A3J28_05510 [Acidobacteria bacterium RIFCSPLOWO2_12_FULL_60_22]
MKQFLAAAGSGVQASLGATRIAIPTTPIRTTDFSSDGPSTDFGIKPDLVAPGTTIYSAAQRNFPSGEQYDPSGFDFSSGTSFSAPLVAGAAALVKQAAPDFTPAQIKSALVNTAVRVVADSLGATPRVLAQGNGLLDVAAALHTPATVSPVSLSFGARAPGTLLSSTPNLVVTNAGSGSDSFSVSVTPLLGAGRVSLTASPASFALAAGASTTLTVSATSSGPLNETIEGYLSIRSENTRRTITVPYWGTFLLPTVNPGGVLNAASFALGPSTVAAGSLVSVFGTQLANETGGAATLPLPKSLGGVRVTMGGVAAPFLFASPSQINAQVPLELSGQTSATLIVRLNGVASSPVSVPLSPAAPGIFTATQNGRGRGAIVHASDFSAVTAEKPARAGEILAVYATGLGPTSPLAATGASASTTALAVTRTTPSATIGGIPAPVRFSGLAPSFVGLYQVNIEVPPGVSSGEQTLLLTSSGVASNPVTVAVAP